MTWLPVIGLFLGALLIRLYRLDTLSLWLDEGNTWHTIQQPWHTLFADLVNPVSAYPLYHVLLKAWVAVAGDSEWALRLPSAMASAMAVVALYFAAIEVEWCAGITRLSHMPHTDAVPATLFPLTAAIIMLASPFALWYAQEAKVYSFFLLMATLFVWSLLVAQRTHTRRHWALFISIALLSVCVHRFALLLWIAAVATIWYRHTLFHDTTWRLVWLLRLLVGVAASVIIVAAMVIGLGSEGSATGAHIPAGPRLALWLTLIRFSVDRGPGDVPWWWLAPSLTLFTIGVLFVIIHTGYALRYHKPTNTNGTTLFAAPMLLLLLCIPTTLFLLQLHFTRFYETRYLILVYPLWVMVIAYPTLFFKPVHTIHQHTWWHYGYWGAIVALLTSSYLVLTQPHKGLFSGDDIKEQFRDAFALLATRTHPDDIVVLHPAYMQPLYDYYMPRFTTDPVIPPTLFAAFKQGQTAFGRREWDVARDRAFAGKYRSFLVIAPEHARTVDIPNTTYHDEYGWIGLYYQYSREQKKWPCGIWRLHGVHVYCQESPEAYVTGEPATPRTLSHAIAHDTIAFLGYTIKTTVPQTPTTYRAGGVIPISLYWQVTKPLDTDYTVFLHLCQDCNKPPVASDDGQPLNGYLPTSTWLPGKPARDDRTIALPNNLAPGKYTLVMGMYPLGNPSPNARVAWRGGTVLDHHRLVITTVTISTHNTTQ